VAKQKPKKREEEKPKPKAQTETPKGECKNLPGDEPQAGLRLEQISQNLVTLQSSGRARRRAGMMPIWGGGMKM